MNKTDGNGSGKLSRTLGKSRAEDRRREIRKQVIGDILWSYVADKDEFRFKGAIIDMSHDGLCILTVEPIKVGSVLKINVKGRRAMRAIIDATVIWCKKGFADIYQSGLSVNDSPINPIAEQGSSFVT